MMFRLVFLIALSCAFAHAAFFKIEDEAAMQTHFSRFVRRFNKLYSDEEAAHRYQVFKANMAAVNGLQMKSKHAEFGITKFADLTPAEFRRMYLSNPAMPEEIVGKAAGIARPSGDLKDLPDSFDWRDKNAVTPVKNQGQCGSCWAFSATEAIESAYFLAGHSLEVLAPQQLVDCAGSTGNQGCNGGYPIWAFDYVIQAGGIMLEKDYPYAAMDDQCSFDKSKVAAKISSYLNVTSEADAAGVLYEKGPLSIAIDASVLQFYVGGVVEAFMCGKQLDHAIMITGFAPVKELGVFKQGAWIVRNSWGADWGMEGYFYLERGHDACGVSQAISIPVV